MTDLGTTQAFPTPEFGGTGSTGSTSTESSGGVKEKADELKGRAADTKDTAVQAGSEVAQTATEKAKDVADETKRQARNLVGEGREQLQTQVQQQHQNLVGQLRTLADQLSAMANGTQQPGQSGLATELVSQAGDRAQQLVSHLENRQPADLVNDVRRLARQHPGTFLAGAALAGIVAGRLTRGAVAAKHADASSTDTYSSGYGAPTYSPTTHPTPGGSIGTDVGVGYTPTTPNYPTTTTGYAEPYGQSTGYSTPAVGEPVQQYPGGAGYLPGDAR